MKRSATVPLGVDVGTARVRVALAERCGAAVRLLAVAARDVDDDPGEALRAAVDELETRERRCVLAVGAPATTLFAARFPPMRLGERERAARFEARRLFSDADTAALRLAPIPSGGHVVALAARAAVTARARAAQRARLRPVAIDDAAYAVRRAVPEADVVVDVGVGSTTIVADAAPVPRVCVVPGGGAALTAALGAALAIDPPAAERRKRSLGLAGAADPAYRAFVERIVEALLDLRMTADNEVRSVALVGNGARVRGLADALTRALAVPVGLATLAGWNVALPGDVVRAAAPDWACAVALADGVGS